MLTLPGRGRMVAQCAECEWTAPVEGLDPESLAPVVEALVVHLASEHHWTWSRAHEEAMAWARSVMQAARGAR